MASKSKKKRSTRQTKKKTNEQSFVRDEITIWVTLAVSIFLLISNFGIGGSVGDAVSKFLMNIFGLVAYAIPFVLFGIVAFIISNKGNATAYVKAAAGIILIILACVFLELLDGWGGTVGGFIVKVLTPAVGVAGTYIIDIISMIICLVVITGKSALGGVKKQSDKAYNKAKEDAKRRREIAEERRKERDRKSVV